MLAAVLRGPANYVPRTGWPAWAVLPAALVISALAVVVGALSAALYSVLADVGGRPAGLPVAPQAQQSMQLVVWLVALQIGMIAFTAVAAGFFSSNRRQGLALVRPAGGWGVLLLALVPLFAGATLWTGIMLMWQPEVAISDLKIFYDLIHSDAVWLIIPVIGIGAPVSEELLFRGFLFSALAKSRLGLTGTSLLTAGLWTAVHAGYSIFGLIEVFLIGLYFSWLLVRTGSLWVTIFCHAAYNTVVAVALLFVVLPA